MDIASGTRMADDVLINKAATIERCVARARQEYNANPEGFDLDDLLRFSRMMLSLLIPPQTQPPSSHELI